MNKWITLLSAVLLSTSLFAANDLVLNDKDIKFSLPIDWTGKDQVNLMVKIPDGFVSIQPMEQWSDASMIEFIPSGEDKDNWTQIVTVHKFLNKGISAKDLSKGIAEYISKQSKDYKVIKNMDPSPNGYVSSGKLISYNFQGKNEVLGYNYYSGPVDCVGIQYTVRPKAGETNGVVAARIEDFLTKNVTVLTGAANAKPVVPATLDLDSTDTQTNRVDTSTTKIYDVDSTDINSTEVESTEVDTSETNADEDDSDDSDDDDAEDDDASDDDSDTGDGQ